MTKRHIARLAFSDVWLGGAVGALLMVLLLGLAPPAYADGQTDIPLTVATNAPGQLIVYEASAASSRHIFMNSYLGGWTGWVAATQYPDTPYTITGNITPLRSFNSAAFTQLADNHMWCGVGQGGTSWSLFSSAPFFSSSFKAATPAVLWLDANSSRITGVDLSGHILTTGWSTSFDLAGCRTAGTGIIWTDTGGQSAYTVGMAGTSASDFLLLAAGTDGRVWWDYNLTGWQATASGRAASAVSLTTWGGGRYDAFVRGTDNALWHTSDPNGTWESLGGQLLSGPACAAWAADRIDCFAIGTTAGSPVYHTWFVGGIGWFPWENLGTA